MVIMELKIVGLINQTSSPKILMWAKIFLGKSMKKQLLSAKSRNRVYCPKKELQNLIHY